MTTKTMSVAEAEKQLDSARQKLDLLEGRLRSGQATLEEHVSAQQFVRFAEDVLKNVRARVTDEERERAEKERQEKARKDHDVLVQHHTHGLTELVGELAATEQQNVRLLEAFDRYNARTREVHRSTDWQALDELNPVVGVSRSPRGFDGPQALLALSQRATSTAGQVPPLKSYEITHGKFFDLDAIERERDAIAATRQGSQNQRPPTTAA